MTDIEYTRVELEKERKHLARSAKAKKGGNSRSCRLSSDKLTNKEIERKHGEMKSYNISKPMSWKCFREMPKDLQKEYISKLRYEHKGNNKEIADMMGIDRPTFSKYICAVFPDLRLTGKNKNRNQPEWLKFISAEAEKEAELEMNIEHCEPEQKTHEAEENNLICVESGSLRITGKPNAIFAKAMLMFDSAKNYNISIIFEEVCNA